MGKGDQRTKRGKIYRGSHGKYRPGKIKSENKPQAPKPPAPKPQSTGE